MHNRFLNLCIKVFPGSFLLVLGDQVSSHKYLLLHHQLVGECDYCDIVMLYSF